MPPLRNAKNELKMQDSEKADILNQFFSSIFVKDDNNNPTFPKRVSNEFTLTSVQITPAIVFAAIRSIKPSNSLDPEGFPSKFYHQLSAELSTPLSIIMQASIDV